LILGSADDPADFAGISKDLLAMGALRGAIQWVDDGEAIEARKGHLRKTLMLCLRRAAQQRLFCMHTWTMYL